MCWESFVGQVDSFGDLAGLSYILGFSLLLFDLQCPCLGLMAFPLHVLSSSSRLTGFIHMGCQSSKKASRSMKGLLVPKLRSDILSLLIHSMGQNKSARVGKQTLLFHGKSYKVML